MGLISKYIQSKQLKQDYIKKIEEVKKNYDWVVKDLNCLKEEYLTADYIENAYNFSMVFYKLNFLNDKYKKFLLKYSQFKHFNNVNVENVTDKKLLSEIENCLNLKKELRQMFERTYTRTKQLKRKVKKPVISINEILTYMIDAFDFNSTAYKKIYANPNLETVLFYS